MVDIDYEQGSDEDPIDYSTLDEKLEKSTEVITNALQNYENPAIMWTGGKDSTLLLYLVKEVANEIDEEIPTAVFIDHGQHFEHVEEFVNKWKDEWGVDVVYARNDDVLSVASSPGDMISVDDLDGENKEEVRQKLNYTDEEFPFLLDTEVGNHLLKTVALNDCLDDHQFDAVFSGIRWDEQESRAEETFFSPRHDSEKYPYHDRIHPILQYKESDVWDALWNVVIPDTVKGWDGGVPESVDDLPQDVSLSDLPISKLYFNGFRSLGSEVSTEKNSEKPAWLQDMDNTVERAGRAQDKEGVMDRLRELGYM